MDSFLGELIKLGAAGLVIWVIAAPLIKYLIDKNKEQDKYIQKLVNDHLSMDWQKHQKIINSLEELNKAIERQPEITLAQIAKTYPPVQLQQTVEAAGRVSGEGAKTTVNVNTQR